jgi:hypothetical protein
MHSFFFSFQFIHKRDNPMVLTVMLPTQVLTIMARNTDYHTANIENMTAKIQIRGQKLRIFKSCLKSS